MSVFHYTHRVTFADCTLGNHIYHSRYLDLLEAARGEFFRHLGKTFLEWQEQDTIFPVIECRLRYKSPARYDELLKIEVQVTAAEGVRLNFHHQILRDSGSPLVEVETWHVCTNLQDRPKRLPDELLQQLQPYLTAESAERA
jgi:acyl-CoA thioester hydrolase